MRRWNRTTPHVRTTFVRTVTFNGVDAEHAWLEGEGDRSLATWRIDLERAFTEFASHDRGFDPEKSVVMERFELIHPVLPGPPRELDE